MRPYDFQRMPMPEQKPAPLDWKAFGVVIGTIIFWAAVAALMAR